MRVKPADHGRKGSRDDVVDPTSGRSLFSALTPLALTNENSTALGTVVSKSALFNPSRDAHRRLHRQELRLEVESPYRLVSTEVFEGCPDAEAVKTLTLTEVDGVTELVVTVVHTNQANRDGHVASGMEDGLQHSLNRIDDLVSELQNTGVVKKSVSMALRSIGKRNPALLAAAKTLAADMARSPDATARWIGNTAHRDLTREPAARPRR